MRNHPSTTSSPLTSSLVVAELGAAADLLRAAAPLPPMMVMYSPTERWRLTLAPERTVSDARQQVAVKRLASKMGAEVVRLPGSPPWARGTWDGTGVFAPAHQVTGDHVGHGDTEEHAELLEELAMWVYEMADAGAEAIWIHQPRIEALNPDHRLRASVHAHPELAARLATLDDAHGKHPGEGAWAGSALTPTGHDVVIVRT